MSFDFDVFDIKDHEIWNLYFDKCPKKSLPQSWEYGTAKSDAEGWTPNRYIVRDKRKNSISIVQVLIKRPFYSIGIARINKGPLIISKDFNDNKFILLSLKAIYRFLRQRGIWIIQLAPLIAPSPKNTKFLRQIGFKKRPDIPADSGLISLEGSDEDLMMSFKGKWRNLLRKGQKLGVKVKHSQNNFDYFQILLEEYEFQQKDKNFVGTSNEMLKALKNNQSENFKFNMFFAYIDQFESRNNLLGALVSIQYGNFSEYLIGVTSQKGKTMQANSVLLWSALLEAKKNNGLWFDVGGLNETTPKGIETYKKGMNPDLYSLIGEWRKWF